MARFVPSPDAWAGAGHRGDDEGESIVTRQKKLKRAVRARAARTGERYAAARAQVEGQRRQQAARAAPAGKPVKGMVSDAACQRATGRGLSHWFKVLDHFGGRTAGHTAAARHLKDAQGVSAWYAQAITVAYERAHGLRAENQTCDGRFQVSVSRVLPASVSAVARALRSARAREAWLDGADPTLAKSLAAAFGRRGALSVKGGTTARLRYRWDGGTVELRLDAKDDGRSTLVADTKGLASKAEVERRRAQWRPVLDALRAHLSG
jgi:hypothetical protein